MERLITIKGIGNVSRTPDWIRINLGMEVERREYSGCLDAAAEQVSQLRKALLPHGFTDRDIRSTQFHVDTAYDRVRDANGDYKQVFRGYECHQRLYILFSRESDLLGPVLESLADCPARPTFELRYEVKDRAEFLQALLESAVADGQRKAEILARAAGVSLGDLVSMDYSWGEIRVYEEQAFMNEKAMCASVADLDLTPDDITAEESVTLVWIMKS